MQGLNVAIAKSIRPRGKNLEHSQEILFIENRHNENGADGEPTAGNGVHARISFGVIANLHLLGLNTSG